MSQNRRLTERQTLANDQITGLVTGCSDATRQPFIMWDLSVDGVGFWVSRPIEKGTSVKITMGSPLPLSFHCQIQWCHKRSDGQGYHCGAVIIREEKSSGDVQTHLKFLNCRDQLAIFLQ